MRRGIAAIIILLLIVPAGLADSSDPFFSWGDGGDTWYGVTGDPAGADSAWDAPDITWDNSGFAAEDSASAREDAFFAAEDADDAQSEPGVIWNGSDFTWNDSGCGRRRIASSSIRLRGTDALIHNVTLAADSVNDTVLPPEGVFSFNDIVGPRTADCGFLPALNGRGVKVVGGGVAQVASAVWLAIRNLDCAAVIEKSTYGSRYNQRYVDNSNDAILTDYVSGQDFSFRNRGDMPITVCTYALDGELICEIYEG